MRRFDAELLQPYLHSLKGQIYEPTAIKIKKFLVTPYDQQDLSIFIQSYTINRWDETDLLDRHFKDNKEFNIIAQYDLTYPNFDYILISAFDKDQLWNIIIGGVERKYYAQGLIGNDNLKDYFELKTEPLSLNFLESKPLASKVRNEIIALSGLVYSVI